MSPADTLISAAAQVDVLDTAGRIIANPKRQAVATTTAEVLALACATERFWAVCLAAEAAIEAATAEHTEDEDENAAREDRAAELIRAFLSEIAAIRNETQAPTEQETDHADSN